MNLKYTQPECEHKDRKHYSRGLCKQCYEAQPDVAIKKKLSRRVTARNAYKKDQLSALIYQDLRLLAFPDELRQKRNKYVAAYRRKNPEYSRMCVAIRRARIAGATIGNLLDIREVYRKARILRQNGENIHVDHIIPLSKGGAHTADNLQIIRAKENLSKGCKDSFTPTRVFEEPTDHSIPYGLSY